MKAASPAVKTLPQSRGSKEPPLRDRAWSGSRGWSCTDRPCDLGWPCPPQASASSSVPEGLGQGMASPLPPRSSQAAMGHLPQGRGLGRDRHPGRDGFC